MLNKTVAEKIYEIAENELSKDGQSSYKTILLMKEVVEKIGKNYLEYFYPEGEKMIFNLKRWKRHFLEDKEALNNVGI